MGRTLRKNTKLNAPAARTLRTPFPALDAPSLPESVAASASVTAVLTQGASSQVNTQPPHV